MFTPKNYEKSKIGNYMRLEVGTNKIRILKEPVTGYVYWEDANGNIVPRNIMAGEGGKPKRNKEFEALNTEERQAIKGFSAMIVWNYNVEKIQILEIKQAGIMTSLEALVNSKSWEDVTKYDIVITKTKTGLNPKDVEYSVMPEPKEKLDKKVTDAFGKVVIDLEALFKNEDPFSSEEKVDLKEVPDDLNISDLDG